MAFALCVPTFFILFSTTVSIVLSQSEEDLRLVKTDVIPPSMNYLGRLDIFWKGKWSTVCGLNRGGAQAACRQLKFSDFSTTIPYSQINQSYVPRADDDMPIAIRNTNYCVYEIPDGLNHILRCGYTTDTAGCSHDNDMVLECRPVSVWAYKSQVRLVSGDYPSSGTLEIYYNGTWGNVCSSKFDQNAANSACRQMGYTNAKAFTTTATKSSERVWLSGVECGSSSL